MVQIAGKYKLAGNKNFYELLVSFGRSEEDSRSGDEIKGTLEVTIDGNKVVMANDSPTYVTNLVLNEEIEETMPGDVKLLSTTTLDGNVITVTSKTKEGQPAGSRTFTFSDSGLEVVINAFTKDGKPISASRTYKRT